MLFEKKEPRSHAWSKSVCVSLKFTYKKGCIYCCYTATALVTSFDILELDVFHFRNSVIFVGFYLFCGILKRFLLVLCHAITELLQLVTSFNITNLAAYHFRSVRHLCWNFTKLAMLALLYCF